VNTRLTAATIIAALALIGPAHADPAYTVKDAGAHCGLLNLAEACPQKERAASRRPFADVSRRRGDQIANARPFEFRRNAA
jgi:hypothetical protein